jgi:hypothetical protein
MAVMGPTSHDLAVVELARSPTRRDFFSNVGRVMAASALASVGLQVVHPIGALGSNSCKYCGPSPVCPSSCCSNGACKPNGGPDPCDGPYGWSWQTCWCNYTYLCEDCVYLPSSTDKCICVKFIGGNCGCQIC